MLIATSAKSWRPDSARNGKNGNSKLVPAGADRRRARQKCECHRRALSIEDAEVAEIAAHDTFVDGRRQIDAEKWSAGVRCEGNPIREIRWRLSMRTQRKHGHPQHGVRTDHDVSSLRPGGTGAR
jgi:hypothetical protein